MEQFNDEKKREGKSKWLILLLLLITFGAVCITIWALFFREPDVILSPDYIPPETEEHAQTLPNDSGDKMQSEDGGGSVSLTYSNQVAIDLSKEQAYLLFANPGKSNQDMVLQIVIQDTVIVQSGAILPGHQVLTLDLLDGKASMLVPGGYEGKFVILYYNPDSGEKAIVNTEIPTFGAVCITIWALFFREPDVILSPDYIPPETEEHAQTLPNDSGDKMQSEDGGGSVSLTYSNQVAIDLSKEQAYLLFANPGKSNQDMVLQIVIQDTVIVQSGAILPGHQVLTLDLLDGKASMLVPGGYEGKFVILYYNPDSGEKAIVNTEIPIQITVTE